MLLLELSNWICINGFPWHGINFIYLGLQGCHISVTCGCWCCRLSFLGLWLFGWFLFLFRSFSLISYRFLINLGVLFLRKNEFLSLLLVDLFLNFLSKVWALLALFLLDPVGWHSFVIVLCEVFIIPFTHENLLWWRELLLLSLTGLAGLASCLVSFLGLFLENLLFWREVPGRFLPFIAISQLNAKIRQLFVPQFVT